MSSAECVLVVDEVPDIAEVLKAVLEPRGVTVNRVRRLEVEHESAQAVRPAVVVLAGDAEAPNAGWRNVPQVIIGEVRFAAENGAVAGSDRRHLPRLFHYAELVQAIEALIATPKG